MRKLSHAEVVGAWIGRLARQARRREAAGDRGGQLQLLRRAADLARQHLPPGDPWFAVGLNNLAAACINAGRGEEGRALLEETLAAQRAALGGAHPQVAETLGNLAEWHRREGRFEAGIPFAAEALEITLARYGEGDPGVSTALQDLARLYQQAGRAADALPLFERALEIRRAAFGDAHPAIAETLNDLADVHRAMGDPGAAIALHRRALRIRRAALGEAHPDTGVSLNNLGVLLQEKGLHRRAIVLQTRSLEIARRSVGKDDPRIGLTLHNLAKAHRDLGWYQQADALGREALEHLRATLGDAHPFTAASRGEMAALRHETGQYDEAAALAHASLDGARRALGEGHPQTIAAVNLLGEIYRSMGRYGEAIPLLRRSLQLRRRSLPPRHPMLAPALSNLALAYYETGRPADALPLLHEALEITEDALGELHPRVGSTLGNLAEVHRALGRHDLAIPLLKRALEIERRELGDRHPRVGWSMSNLGIVLQEMGLHEQGMELLELALGLLVPALGEGHASIAIVLNNLGVAHARAGDHGRAVAHLERAAALHRAALREVHPSFAATLASLAASLFSSGRRMHALATALRASAVDDRLVAEVFPVSSERERLGFLQGLRKRDHALFSLVWRMRRSRRAARAAMDVALRRKGVAADALAAQRDAVLGGRYPALLPRLRALGELRARVARAALAGAGAGDADAHRRQLAEWSRERDELEAGLARQIPEMSLERRFRAVDRRAVAAALPEASALVELVRFDAYGFEARPAFDDARWLAARYLALVMHAGDPDGVRVIDLGEAAAVERALAGFRDAVTLDPDTPDAELEERWDWAVPGRALRTLVFDPLLPALGPVRRLFIAPDGDLSRLPFEVLPDDGEGHLVDTWRISYLTSGRDLLAFGTPSGVAPGAPVVVAAPDFDLRKGRRARRRRTAAGRRSRDLDRESLEFDPLPATELEGAWIAELLGVEPWLGADALEGRLKEVRSPAVLHLATHGVFLQDQPADPGELPDDTMDASAPGTSAAENPLLRSLLALAGANTWLRGRQALLPAAAEDGLLTAEEVSAMDLLATELVVLSACETGLGLVQTGEGVFGLRRAFVVAGARTLVMSLWKLPDEDTRELMLAFYDRLLAGEPRADALRNAQLEMKDRFGDPFSWGAFILQGDPGPLRLADGNNNEGAGLSDAD